MLHELNWANVFNSTIVDSEWFKDQSISPGRFAAGYPLLYYLYRILNDTNPKTVLEFGLGQSTKMLFQYAGHYKNVKVTSLEHDPKWIRFFSNSLKASPNAEIVHVENVVVNYKGEDTLSVLNIPDIVGRKTYDLIVVDAPYGSERYSRSQILQLIPGNINKNNFCIIMDDFEREGEKETCVEIERLLHEHQIVFHKKAIKGEKFFALYCSDDLTFLKSI